MEGDMWTQLRASVSLIYLTIQVFYQKPIWQMGKAEES
jgi:hypothetical protein